MKFRTIFMMVIAAICSMSCSKTDDVENVADSVIGTYNGTLEMKVAGNNAGSSEIAVEVTKESETTVSITITNKEAVTGGMSIGKIEIDDITVADAGNSVYTLSKTVSKDGFSATDTASPSKIIWTFKSFSGSVESGNLKLDMMAQPGAMPMPLTLEFVGSK